VLAGLRRQASPGGDRTELFNGSEILWRPAHEVDRYRGLNLSWFWLDEAPYCGYEAWRILKATLRPRGWPTMGWATGTPLGQDGYALDFELARKPRHRLFRASTSDNAAHLPRTFVEDLGYSGDLADQEIEGLFVAFSGLVYRFLRDVHVRSRSAVSAVGSERVTPAVGPLEHGVGSRAAASASAVNGWSEFKRVIGAIDWGYTNPTAAVVFGLDADSRAWQVGEYYARRASLHDERLPAIVELSRKHQVAAWYCDSEDPGNIGELNAALARGGLQTRATPAQKGPGSVADGIQTVTRLLAVRSDGLPGLLVDPSCVNTIAEYGMYRYPAAPEGTALTRDPRDEPVKLADHAMDATRFALHDELGWSYCCAGLCATAPTRFCHTTVARVATASSLKRAANVSTATSSALAMPSDSRTARMYRWRMNSTALDAHRLLASALDLRMTFGYTLR
jgi:hypothetical protein